MTQRVIRVICYESDDPARMDCQLEHSLKDGHYTDLATVITIATVPKHATSLLAVLVAFLAPFTTRPQSLFRRQADPLRLGDDGGTAERAEA